LELNFIKIKFYVIKYNVKLECEKIKFYVCHISSNCIKFDFGEVELYFELNLENVKFQKEAT